MAKWFGLRHIFGEFDVKREEDIQNGWNESEIEDQ